MLLKILLVGALLTAGMAALKDGRLLARAGIVGSCHPVATTDHSEVTFQRCQKGRLEGFPDLEKKSCQLVYTKADRQYWRCLAPIVSSQAPRG